MMVINNYNNDHNNERPSHFFFFKYDVRISNFKGSKISLGYATNSYHNG